MKKTIKLGVIKSTEIKRDGSDHLQAQKTFKHTVTKNKKKLHPRQMKYKNYY